MKKFLMLVSLAAFTLSGVAQQISVSSAQRNALQFIHKSPRAKMKAAKPTDLSLAYTGSTDGFNTFYVFNLPEGGYIIAGADENAREILGYSASGSFDYGEMPANMKWWLGEYTKEISAAIEQDAARKGKVSEWRKRTAGAKHDIAPLVSAQWGQSTPYNKLCPGSGESRTLTGCVATAMAQVMYTYQWPTTGTGSKSYLTYTYIFDLTSDFSSHTYDWGQMKNSTGENNASTASQDAVAQLCYDAGVSVDMDYGYATLEHNDGGSGANSYFIAGALGNYFGYDKSSLKHVLRLNYTNEEWEDALYTELDEGRPVIYDGLDTDAGGHSFICDGYQASTDLYHFNWGWDGFADDYYAITGTPALNPSAYIFTSYQEMTIGIKKDVSGTSKWRSHLAAALGGDFSITGQYDTGFGMENKYQYPYLAYDFGGDDEHPIANLTGGAVKTCPGVQVENLYTDQISNAYSLYDQDWNEDECGCYTTLIAFCDLNDSKTGTGVYKITPIYADYNDKDHPQVLRTSISNKNTATLIVGEEASFYDLKVGESGVATLCLPYPVTIPEGVEIWYLTSSGLKGGWTQLSQFTGTKLAGNMAVVVKGTPNTTYTFNKATSGTSIGDNILGGCTDYTAPETGKATYVLANKSSHGLAFYKFNGDKLNPFRAYLTLSDSEVKDFIGFDFEDETGIEDATPSTETKGGTYNLAGQRVGKDYKGVVIENGEKMWRK